MATKPLLHLDKRTRAGLAILLVCIAIVHLLFPTLAIDPVFLGLLAMAAVIYFFEITRLDVMGVEATATALETEAEEVKAASIPPSTGAPMPIPTTIMPASIEHRPPMDLMPPTDKAARVLWSIEQIRVELIVIAGNGGLLSDARPWDSYRPVEVAEMLRSHHVVPDALVTGIRTAVEQRNLLAHGRLTSLDLLAPLDELCTALVIKVREIPREYIRVHQSEVPLYVDRSLSARHPLMNGVKLRQFSMNGELLVTQVFPTDKTYGVGRYVSWEWDFSRSTKEEAWYLDGNAPKLAFSSSASFAGREYPDQWGVLYWGGGPLVID